MALYLKLITKQIKMKAILGHLYISFLLHTLHLKKERRQMNKEDMDESKETRET